MSDNYNHSSETNLREEGLELAELIAKEERRVTRELSDAAKALLEVANEAIADHEDDCAREPDERHDLDDPECEVNARMLAKVCEFALSACEGEKAGETKADEPAWSGWTDWPGGECPIPWAREGEYCLTFDNGPKDGTPRKLNAVGWNWRQRDVCYISAYRYRLDRAPKPDEPGLNWKLSDEARAEIEQMQRANTRACAKAGDFIMRSADRTPKE